MLDRPKVKYFILSRNVSINEHGTIDILGTYEGYSGKTFPRTEPQAGALGIYGLTPGAYHRVCIEIKQNGEPIGRFEYNPVTTQDRLFTITLGLGAPAFQIKYLAPIEYAVFIDDEYIDSHFVPVVEGED